MNHEVIVPTAEEHADWCAADARRRTYIAAELRALHAALPLSERGRLVALVEDMARGDIASVDVVGEWRRELAGTVEG